MKIVVKLFATLRQGRFKVQSGIYPEAAKVQDIVEGLAISPTDLGIIFVNGKSADLNRVLQEGDTLSIFPPVGGG